MFIKISSVEEIQLINYKVLLNRLWEKNVCVNLCVQKLEDVFGKYSSCTVGTV